MNKNITMLLSAFLLTACGSKGDHAPAADLSAQGGDQEINDILNKSAAAAADAQTNLALIEQAKSPMGANGLLEIDVDPVLKRRMNMVWSGPIAPVLFKLSKEAGYSFEIVGQPPASSIQIRVARSLRTLKELLDEIGLQAGKRATVMVDQGRGKIQLVYNYVG